MTQQNSHLLVEPSYESSTHNFLTRVEERGKQARASGSGTGVIPSAHLGFGKPFSWLDFLRPLWATQSYDNSAQMFPLTLLSVEITFPIHLQSTPLQRPDVGKPSSQGNQQWGLKKQRPDLCSDRCLMPPDVRAPSSQAACLLFTDLGKYCQKHQISVYRWSF